MPLISRYVITRFIGNFVLLMALLFVFAISIDVFVQLHRFVEAAHAIAGDHAGPMKMAGEVLALIADFQAPRLFQFYAYMHGMVAIGAIGFTLGTMHTRRELVAILAAGVSMHRIAQPLLIAVFGLSVLQVLNQEFIIPKVAPLLIRDQGDIGKRGVKGFPINLTRDGHGNLLQAASFDPVASTLTAPLILERDKDGRTVRRISADMATYSTKDHAWMFENGTAMWLVMPADASGKRNDNVNDSGTAPGATGKTPIEKYVTDLTPEALTIRRFGQFATMLSLQQIGQLARSPGVVDADALARYKYSRFSSVLVNLLVATIALPFFLLREPVGLMRQSLLCAAVTVPAMLGATIGVTMPLPGIPPIAGVFIPVIILLPIAIGRIAYIKT